MIVNVLKIIPRFLLAMFTFEFIWSLKVRFLSNITPLLIIKNGIAALPINYTLAAFSYIFNIG